MAVARSLSVTPSGLAISYGLFGGLYIVFSDSLLVQLAGDYSVYAQLQTAKGWAFILVTSIALWALSRHMRKQLSDVAGSAELAEDQIRLAMTAANGMIWSLVTPEEGEPVWHVSGGLGSTLGLSAGPMPTADVSDALYPADRGAFTEWVAALVEGRPPQSDLFRFVGPDSSVYWVKLVQDPRVRDLGQSDMRVGVAFDFTHQQEAARDLAEVIVGAELGTWRLNLRTGHCRINERWTELLGYSRAELEPLTEQKFLALVHPDDRAKLMARRTDWQRHGERLVTDEFRMLHKLGHWVWVLSRWRPVEYSDAGEPLVLTGVHIDITRRKELEVSLNQERDFLISLTQTSVAGILVMRSDGRISFANAEAAEILGLPVVDLLNAPLVEACNGISDLDGRPLAPSEYPFRKALVTAGAVRNQRVLIALRNGWTKAISVNASTMKMPNGNLQVVSSVIDISAQLANEAALVAAAEESHAISLRDAMTGLPNRKRFAAQLQDAIDDADVSGGQVMQVFLDIDNFKQVNDRFGHRVGDLLICEVGHRLNALCQPGQMLAHVSGDEFNILHPLKPGEEIEGIAARFASAFDTPFDLEGRTVFTTVSMGISVYPDDAASLEELTVNADLAMYEAKACGRNQIVRYTSDLRDRQNEEGRIAQVLQSAIKSRAFAIVLQPQWFLDRPKILAGAEALLRCTDSRMVGLGPGDYLPIAAWTGLMPAIDLLVVDLVGEAMARLRAGGKRPRISINLSPDSLLKPDFGRALLRHLDKVVLEPRDIVFELTEGALVDLSFHAKESLDLLRVAGFQLSADDFGTGYSSLSYLHRLQLTELKIDQSFIQRLGAPDEPSDDIVKAILAICRSLGLRAVAEGIETEAQMTWLHQNGCTVGQGFLWGKSFSVDDFAMICTSAEQSMEGLQMTS